MNNTSKLIKGAIGVVVLIGAVAALALAPHLNKHDVPPKDSATQQAAADDFDPPAAFEGAARQDDAVAEVASADGSTDSDVPTGVIRDAINHDDKLTQWGAYPVQTWKETNTYTRKIDDEKVVFIEVRGTFHLAPENMEYLHSKGGISFPVASYERDGAIEVVKRGNSWYILKG